MPRRPTPPSLLAAALGLLGLCVSGCQQPGAERIVGPDGSQMSHVHCGADQASCFRIAGELCPTGYDMKPVLSSSDGNFLVRCRSGAAPQVAGCPPTAPGAVVMLSRSTVRSNAPASPSEAWPPSNEPWPLMYPWPPPETTAGVGPVPATPATNKEIDLGY